MVLIVERLKRRLKMNRLILSGLALLFTAGSALAADLAIRKAPPPAPPPPLWTGPFLGASIGAGFGDSSNDVSGKTLYCGGINCSSATSEQYFFAPTSSSDDGASFAGGAQVGYNYQFDPRFVVGGVVDFTAFNRSGSTSFTTPPIPIGGGSTETRSYSDSFKNNWLVTARLRAGPTFDNLWIYGTGGLALAHLNSSSSTVTTWYIPGWDPQIAASGSGSTSGVGVGYVVGGGAEYKLSPNWSIFGEYLYYAVNQSYTVIVTPNTELTGVSGSASYGVTNKVNGSLVKLGVNYTFQTH
jgi:outer membrane immunogenic protein